MLRAGKWHLGLCDFVVKLHDGLGSLCFLNQTLVILSLPPKIAICAADPPEPRPRR